MDQQRSAIKHIIKCFSCLPLALTYVLSLNRQFSSLINHLEVAPTLHHLAQNCTRPAPVVLPRFCNLRTKVWNVRNHRLGAIRPLAMV